MSRPIHRAVRNSLGDCRILLRLFANPKDVWTGTAQEHDRTQHRSYRSEGGRTGHAQILRGRVTSFLSDPGRKVQKDLDIAEYTDPEHNPMIPHVIVLEPRLVIFKVYNGYWFFGRPTIEELRQDLHAVLKKCRPDWDISRPELKAAWEQGQRDRFYPYGGKTYGQVFREQE